MISSTEPNIWQECNLAHWSPAQWATLVSAILQANHSLCFLLDPDELVKGMEKVSLYEQDQFGNLKITLTPQAQESLLP